MEALFNGVIQNSFVIAKTYIVLPAYNEAAALSLLIPNITQSLQAAHRPFEVIVVNDGSTDETSRLLGTFAEPYSTQELRHEKNQGYGSALKTGFLWVVHHAKSEDALVTLDADNTHDPVYIPQLLAKLEEGNDVATASYSIPGGQANGVPWTRQMMSFIINTMFRAAISLAGAHTYTNGFRAYRISALQKAFHKYENQLIEESGFPGGTEIFLKVAGLGGQLGEVPFVLHYDRRGTGSKIHLVSTIRKYLRLLVKGRTYGHP